MTNTNAAASNNNPASDATAKKAGQGNGNRLSYFDSVKEALNAKMAGKLSSLSSVTQRLAEASDYRKAGTAEAMKALEIEQEAGRELFGLRVTGTISKEEVTAKLGDVYGFKVSKTTGKTSKTPESDGEAIRKRVERLFQSVQYVGGEEPDTFHAGLPVDEVKSVADAVASGSLSIWSAYDNLTKMKAEYREKVDAAFDVKRIAAIVDALMGNEGAVDRIADSEPLSIAYASLIDALAVLNPMIEAKKAEIAGKSE